MFQPIQFKKTTIPSVRQLITQSPSSKARPRNSCKRTSRSRGRPTTPIKSLLLSIALAAVSAVRAATITFTGVIDQSSQFSVGDVLTATFQFDPHKGRVGHYVITVGNELSLSGTKGGGMVALDNNPTHGSVYYQ